jgi:uncharacterized damage-inducible protein DinB
MPTLTEQVKAECLRRLDEGEARILKCLGLLSDDQVWHQANAHVVSVGNLVLHLCGNLSQWVVSTLGHQPDERRREREFDAASRMPVPELQARLAAVMASARNTIGTLTEDDLQNSYAVQGFTETGTAIVLHVVEHFSYHAGQITLHTKLLLDIDTGYYSGQDLNASS